MIMPNYSRHVTWSTEDRIWTASIAEFPELETVGDTPAAAIASMDVALENLIDQYAEEGWTLPQPDSVEADTPGWIYGMAALGVLETGVILIWLALRWMPAGW